MAAIKIYIIDSYLSLVCSCVDSQMTFFYRFVKNHMRDTLALSILLKNHLRENLIMRELCNSLEGIRLRRNIRKLILFIDLCHISQ